AHVGFEGLARLVEALQVEKLVIPLPRRILLRGVNLAIDERDQVGRPKARRRIRHAQRRDAAALLRMMARERPDHRRAPVVPDPDRLLAPEMSEQLEHVRDALLQRVILMAAMRITRSEEHTSELQSPCNLVCRLLLEKKKKNKKK